MEITATQELEMRAALAQFDRERGRGLLHSDAYCNKMLRYRQALGLPTPVEEEAS